MPCLSSSATLSGRFLRDLFDFRLEPTIIYTTRLFASTTSRKQCSHTCPGVRNYYSHVESSISERTTETDDNHIPFESFIKKSASSFSSRHGHGNKAFVPATPPYKRSAYVKSPSSREPEVSLYPNEGHSPSPNFNPGDPRRTTIHDAEHVQRQQRFDVPILKKQMSQGVQAKSEAWEVNTPRRETTIDTKASFRDREQWQVQKNALRRKFGGEGWQPRKRLSPDALEGIRALHAQHPEKYSTPVLAEQFKISPEAIRRILRSKWKPNEEEQADRLRRWDKRGENIWSQMVELGVKPPKKWREMGISRPPVFRSSRGNLGSSGKTSLSEAPNLPIELTLARKKEDSNDLSLSDRIL